MMRTANGDQEERKQEGGGAPAVVLVRAEDGRNRRVRGQESCHPEEIQIAESLYGGHMMVPLTPTQMVRMSYGPEQHENVGCKILCKVGEEDCGGLEWSSSSSSNSAVDDGRGDLMDGYLCGVSLRLPPVKLKRHRSEQLEESNNECQVGRVDIHPEAAEKEEEEEPCTPKDQPIITEIPQAPKRQGLLEGFHGVVEYDVGSWSPMCCFEFEEGLEDVSHERFDWD